MESRVVHDGNEELIIFKAICYFQSEREEIPSQPTNAPPSYTSTAAVDGGVARTNTTSFAAAKPPLREIVLRNKGLVLLSSFVGLDGVIPGYWTKSVG